MSLDYWRNEEKTCYLSFIAGEYTFQIMEDPDSGDVQLAEVTVKDLINLRNSIDLILSS